MQNISTLSFVCAMVGEQCINEMRRRFLALALAPAANWKKYVAICLAGHVPNSIVDELCMVIKLSFDVSFTHTHTPLYMRLRVCVCKLLIIITVKREW